MQNSFVLSLGQDIAILLSFSMIYDYFWMHIDKKNSLWFKITGGVFLSIVGYVLILSPWIYVDGIFFDTRTVMLSVAGLFFGAIPTFIAIVALSIYRFILGGPGAIMGITTIVTSGLIGILWQYLKPHWADKKPVLELFKVGILVHLVMLASTMLLPAEIGVSTFKTIFIPVFLVYPTATIMLGLLMLQQSKNRENKKALKVSEERWRFAIEGSGDGLWDWNNEENEIYLSKQLKKMLGYDEDEKPTILPDWKSRIHPDDYARVRMDAKQFLLGEISQLDSEYRVITKNGQYIWIQDRGMVMSRDKNRKVIRSIGTYRNITQRKLTEQALLESQKYTNSILSAIPDLIFVLNTEGEIVDFKSGKVSDLYLQTNNFIDKKIKDIMPPQLADSVLSLMNKVLGTNHTEMFEFELEFNNKVNCFEAHILPFTDARVICMARNITERKKTEQELVASQKELKRFAAHLQNIGEEERINLAREIHDELGQILVAVKMDLGMVQKKANRFLDADNSDEFKQQFNHLVKLVDHTINTARKIMTDLRPEGLDMIGLVETVKQHIVKFEERHQIKCIFNSEIEVLKLNKEQSVALFRIVQEALTNIAKHSKATEVTVFLGLGDKDVYLEIADNGVGFDSLNTRQDAYGLIGMNERAHLLDGHCNIESNLNLGTKITVSFPYLYSFN